MHRRALRRLRSQSATSTPTRRAVGSGCRRRGCRRLVPQPSRRAKSRQHCRSRREPLQSRLHWGHPRSRHRGHGCSCRFYRLRRRQRPSCHTKNQTTLLRLRHSMAQSAPYHRQSWLVHLPTRWSRHPCQECNETAQETAGLGLAAAPTWRTAVQSVRPGRTHRGREVQRCRP